MILRLNILYNEFSPLKTVEMDKKRNLILVFLLVLPAVLLAGGLTWFLALVLENVQENDAWREKGLYKIGQVVVTERNIKAESIIKPDDIFERTIDPDSIRASNCLCKDFVIGKKASFALSADTQITCDDIGVSQSELEAEELKKKEMCPHDKATKISQPKNLFVVKATKALAAADILKLTDLKIEKAETGFDTTTAIRDIRTTVGHQLRYDVKPNQTLVKEDLTIAVDAPPTVFVTVRDLSSSDVISDKDIKAKILDPEEYPLNAIFEKSFIVGTKPIQAISRDQIIRNIDITKR